MFDSAKYGKYFKEGFLKAISLLAGNHYVYKFFEFTVAIGLLTLVYYGVKWLFGKKKTVSRGDMTKNRAMLEEIQQRRMQKLKGN